MCVEDPTYINGITKRLYHDIATKRNTVATRGQNFIFVMAAWEAELITKRDR